VNVAVTERDWLIVTVHVVEAPEQLPPDQPTNVSAPSGVAVSVTDVPLPWPTEQVVPVPPQSRPVDVPSVIVPAGEEVTFPLPTMVEASSYRTVSGPEARLTES
jgi:hypothetical protein